MQLDMRRPTYAQTLGGALGMALAVLAVPAAAQEIDRIEVQRAGKEAEIVIRFTTPVQYQRHVPRTSGSLLQVFVTRVEQLPSGVRHTPETIKQPGSDLIPGFTLTYPDLNGALTLRFNRATMWRVRQRGDERSLSIFVPIQPAREEVKPTAKPTAKPAAKPLPAPDAAPAAEPAPTAPTTQPSTPPSAPASELERDAGLLLEQAQAASAKRDFAGAIDALNRLLNLPPNSHSEQAQVLVGEAREGNGEVAKAKAEYQLYLKLYPDGQYAVRVKQRLAALSGEAAPAMAQPQEARPAPRRQEDTGWVLSGSLSQNYYYGNSQIEILTAPPPGELTFSRENLSSTDQSALVSNLDLNYRRRTSSTDTRFVLRDTDTQNFLEGQNNLNRLNSAYFERSDKEIGYLGRIGRQTANNGGVLGRFDGIWAGYNLTPSWRVNAVWGLPVEYSVSWQKSMYGVSLDLIPQAEKVTGSAYAITQLVEGVSDRQAVGMELRYFDAHGNYFALFDYDVMFSALNIAMLQGNYQMESGTSLFALIDHRKSPILQLTNAAPGLPQQTIAAALAAGVSEATLRDKAALKTAEADLFQLGFTHPLTPRWQIGADYRLARVSDSWGEDSTTGVMTLQAGTGNIHVVSGQVIGNAILWDNDVFVVNGSVIRADSYDGESLSVSHVLNLARWRIDSSLAYYTQKDTSDTRLQRWNPVFRVSYRLRDNWSLESELGMEYSTTTGPTSTDTTQRHYFFIGYRWEW